MESWIFLSIIYGLLCGVSDLFKKQSLKKVPVTQNLIIFNFVILVILIIGGGNYSLSFKNFLLIMLKSFCVFLGWLTGFRAIKKIDISNYSIIMLSKVIFTSMLSVIMLNEKITLNKVLGFVVISFGIIISNLGKSNKKIKFKYVLLTLLSSALISTSLFLDKIILKQVSNFSLQFYYTLVLLIFLLVFIIFKGERLNFGYAKTSLSVINLGIITYIADFIHFVAASNPNSSVVVMTLTRHSSLIVTVFLGSIIFNEKHYFQKFISVLIIIAGLVLTVI